MTTTNPVSTFLTGLLKVLPQLLLALALLAVLGVLGALHTITGAETDAGILAVTGATAVSAGTILGSLATANSQTFPHLVIVIGATVLAAILAARGVLTDAEVYGVLGLIFGGGALAVGSAGSSSTPAPTPSSPALDALQRAVAGAQAELAQLKAQTQPPA